MKLIKDQLLIVLFNLLSFSSFSQDLQIIELSDSIENSYLEKIFPLDGYCVYFDEVRNMTEYHVLGEFTFFLSKTKDTLALFDGKLCGGHEGGVVNLYQFEHGEPRTLISRPGKIAARENDEIWVYNYPCCASVQNLISKFSLTTGEKLSETHLFYSRMDFVNVFPISQNETQEYQLAKDSELRWSPLVNEQVYTPVCGNYETVIDTLKSGTTFTLIKLISTNWALIRLDNQPVSEGFCLNDYHQKLIGDETYSLYGWVRAENIKKK